MGKCSDLWILIPTLGSIIVTVSSFGIQTSDLRASLFHHGTRSSTPSLLVSQRREPTFCTTRLYTQDPSKAATSDEDKAKVEREELSDLDARVLRSIMESDDLDLKTEENMKKLLERGTVKSTKDATAKQRVKSNDSEFKSDFLQVGPFCLAVLFLLLVPSFFIIHHIIPNYRVDICRW